MTRAYNRGPRVRRDGYVDVWDPSHPLARRDGYVMEHRKVAWDAGLLTDPSHRVHHVNEVKDDNRLENFEIKLHADHARDHAEERGWVVNQFGVFVVKPRDERQSAPKPERACAVCGAPIPPTKRRDALHCSKSHQITAWKRAHR